VSAPEVPGAPPLPIAKRLNRNALTVAAILMGVTVLVAVVTLNAKRPGVEAKPAADAPTPIEAQPSFLDVPARRDVVMPPLTTTGVPRPDTMPTTLPASVLAGPDVASYADPYTAPGAISSHADRVADAYHRALVSPVLASASSVVNSPLPTQGTTTTGAGATALPDITGAASNVVMAPAIVASSPYQIDAGTVIPAALIRAINSDLPGQLVAQVIRNVYDSRTLRTLLVPQGTKLIGRYSADVAAGQKRLQIIWTRLIFPDGRSLMVPDAEAADGRGATGVPGQVNNHERRIFGTALLTSVISAAAQLSQPQQSGGALATPSARQVAAGALGQELSTVGLETLRRNLDLRPTITLSEGTAINVLLRSDLDLRGPYVPASQER
jgi:type IV secretory pathway VirB10-like protein